MEANNFFFHNWALREMEYSAHFLTAYYFRIGAVWSIKWLQSDFAWAYSLSIFFISNHTYYMRSKAFWNVYYHYV